jgi:hypothetical protein
VVSKLSWYWHRLRAMSPGEVAMHVRKKWRQAADSKRTSWPEVNLVCSGAFPKLPKPEDAPAVLREALKRDAENIQAGRWKFFGHLDLQVDDPPKWQYDCLVRREMETSASAFKLDYRSLPEGVDSKLIWEPSRWHQLVRLAMAAYVLGDGRAAAKCVEWLEDWVKHNPAYRGWNWTSALEAGMRLVQFTWIDALLTEASVASGKSALRESDGPPSPRPSPPGEGETSSAPDDAMHPGASGTRSGELPLPGAADEVSAKTNSMPGRSEGERKHRMTERLESLRREILPPHAWYAWRHRSFGSSANNHLIGELAGLILATVRWPVLARYCASIEELQARWEHEVLTQFAEDGGNQEQALNYHLFSWEFCWQAGMALAEAGRKVSPEVDERLRRAEQFFVEVQVPGDPWDYGDSDSAFVTPLFVDGAVAEWHRWFSGAGPSVAMDFWLRRAAAVSQSPIADGQSRSGKASDDWDCFEKSGYAVRRKGDWTLRWDLSPLGLGTMAAHGHLDALHLSLWLKGVALVIDPGTGAYHADKQLRIWLASRGAHNGATPDSEEWPQRLGPFLWADVHEAALVNGGLANAPDRGWGAEFFTTALSLHRSVEPSADGHRLEVEDSVSCLRHDWADAARGFSVRWQFAPESSIAVLAGRQFRVTRRGVSMEVQVSADWAEVFCVTEQSQVAKADPDAPLAGTVSPAFRKMVWAPYLKLSARPQGDKPCVFTTTFLASTHA